MTTRRRHDNQHDAGHADDGRGDGAPSGGQPLASVARPAAPRSRAGDGQRPAPVSPAGRTDAPRPVDRTDGQAGGVVRASAGAAADDARADSSPLEDELAEASTGNASTPGAASDASSKQRGAAATIDGDGDSDGDSDEHSGESQERAGVDARRRGWFWHWNNVVTQYAPLIGLKGVGLLNSYTVWTDRRDESPHRGYAFPSQQSESGFYGEERAELITINKILVALDLIEIRKEMLTRVDERGRRWRVPHNLYRVRDRPDGVDLRASDVMRVANLAKQDAAVFRYVRRVFSDRFRPIDGDNVWHAILSELRHDPIWRELQERTRAIEARASDRTRAGHQSRASASTAKSGAASSPLPSPDAPLLDRSEAGDSTLPVTQQIEPEALTPETSVEHTNNGRLLPAETVVDRANTALATAVAGSNTASAASTPTMAAGSNAGRESVVGTGNTTYDQTDLTTTTTTTRVPESAEEVGVSDLASPTSMPVVVTQHSAGASARTTDEPVHASGMNQGTGGPAEGVITCNGGDGAVDLNGLRSADGQPAARSTTAVIPNANVTLGGTDEGLEDAHGRRVVASSAEIDRTVDERIEGGSDDRRSPGARAGGAAGERRLADAVAGGPLVDPGPLVVSTFEAANDRRATPLERLLLAELERDADPAARAAGSSGSDWVVAAMREAVASGSAFVAPKRVREIIARWSADPRNAPAWATPVNAPPDRESSASVAGDAAVDVRLPGGASGNAVWAAVLADLARSLDNDAYDRLLAGSHVTRYSRGIVEIRVGSAAAAGKLSNEYRGMVERCLNSRLRRPVAVRFDSDPAEASANGAVPASTEQSAPDTPEAPTIAASEVEVGRQVWQSLLSDLARSIAPADLNRLAGVVVLGQDAAGAILLGAPSLTARRLLDGRHRADVETSLAALLGQRSPVRVLDACDWSVAPDQ